MAIDNKDKKVLNVPHLRFPEFSGEWENTELQYIAPNICSGKDKPTSNGTVALYGSTGIIGMTRLASYNEEIVLVARVGANAGQLQITTIPCGVTDNTLIINAKEWNRYIYYYLQHYNLNRLVFGSGQPLITGSMLKKLKIIYGEESERNKIVNLLCLLDERIATQNKIIYKLKSLIRGIMVELQKRGLSNGTWKKVLLSNVLTERNELNKSLYPVYSVSVIQGIVNQMEYLGRSFAASDTSKYHVVHYGDLVYTKSPTGSFPYGIIKQSYNQNEVAVSPLYGVYEPKTFSTGVFLHEYFKSELNTLNYLHPLVQKGAKNTINIANQRFLESYVAIPSNANELLAISKLLCSLNTKLEFLQNILKQSQGQKQYLLRQMFI